MLLYMTDVSFKTIPLILMFMLNLCIAGHPSSTNRPVRVRALQGSQDPDVAGVDLRLRHGGRRRQRHRRSGIVSRGIIQIALASGFYFSFEFVFFRQEQRSV